MDRNSEDFGRKKGISRRRLIAGGTALPALSHISPAAADSSALIPVSVRMDWVFGGYHAAFFVGVKNGFYRNEGLSVDVEPGNGSGNVAQSIGHGNGQFGLVDGGTMMNLVSKGLKVRAIMGILQQSPLSVIYRSGLGLKTPRDLAGKPIGATSGEAPLVLFPAFLRASGVDASKIDIININPAAKVAMMLTRRVDGLLDFGFVTVPLLQEAGLAVQTFNYADYGVDVPGLSLIASDETLETQPDITRRFLRATAKAYAWTMQNTEPAIDILIAATPNQNIKRGPAIEMLKYSFGLARTKASAGLPFGVMAPADWSNAQQILVRYQGMTPLPSVNAYFTNEFIKPA